MTAHVHVGQMRQAEGERDGGLGGGSWMLTIDVTGAHEADEAVEPATCRCELPPRAPDVPLHRSQKWQKTQSTNHARSHRFSRGLPCNRGGDTEHLDSRTRQSAESASPRTSIEE